MCRNGPSTAEHGAPGEQALDEPSMVRDPTVEALSRHRDTPLVPFRPYECVSVEPAYEDKVADGRREGWAV